MPPNLHEVLRSARNHGVSVDALQWHDQHNVHESNQYMTIDGCLYWNLPYFQYSAIIDIDEYTTYRQGVVKQLPDMLDELRGTNPRLHFCFSITFPPTVRHMMVTITITLTLIWHVEESVRRHLTYLHSQRDTAPQNQA